MPPSESLLEKLDVHWYKQWNKLKQTIQLDSSYKEKWQALTPLLEQISMQNNVLIMILNALTGRIIYHVDKRNLCGYDTAMYMAENGFDVSMSLMHPHYLQAVLKMNETAIKFLSDTANKNRDEMIANVEGLYKRADGEYFHFLQQTVCLETDENKNPFLFLSYVHDVSHFKKSGTANFVITTPGMLKWWNFNFEKNCLDLLPPLSKQEKKILNYLAEGKSSKKIAQSLSISHHTVDTHRRRLLDKTNCTDTTGMITYARLVGLL